MLIKYYNEFVLLGVQDVLVILRKCAGLVLHEYVLSAGEPANK